MLNKALWREGRMNLLLLEWLKNFWKRLTRRLMKRREHLGGQEFLVEGNPAVLANASAEDDEKGN